MNTTLVTNLTGNATLFTDNNTVTMEGSTASMTQTAIITSDGNLTECKAENNLFTLSYQPLILTSFVLNGLLFAAALVDRVKLTRQNYMFACVISTLLSNILYLIFFEWIIMDNYFEADVVELQTNKLSGSKMLWTFTESVSVTVPFIICGNITSLTYVTITSASYVGRVANTDSPEKSKRSFAKKKRVALISIAISWIVPIVMTILGMTTMNCVKQCSCPSTNFEGEICPIGTGCSRMWSPLTFTFLIINAGLWLISTTVLITVVLYGFRKHHKASHSRNSPINIPEYRRDSQDALGGPVQDENPEFEMEAQTTANNNEFVTTQTSGPPKTNENVGSEKRKIKINRNRSTTSRRHQLNSRLRFAITLTIMYCACTVPFIVTIIVDAMVFTASHVLMFALSRVPMYIYTSLCPIIMVKYLPRLKSSVLKLFQIMKSCCKR